MGDWFQTIVDIDATPQQAPELAAAVLDWFVERGVVLAERTDCVLGGNGHAAGPNYTSAVTRPDPSLHTLRTNGLQVITERTVFHSSEVERISCPHCGAATHFTVDSGEPDDAWENMSANIATWYSGGNDAHSCSACGRTAGLNEWRWDPPWGFGYLGFTFWNWPPIKDDFVIDLAHRLGHRTVHPRGKL
jgi:hypothetical protein